MTALPLDLRLTCFSEGPELDGGSTTCLLRFGHRGPCCFSPDAARIPLVPTEDTLPAECGDLEELP